MASISEFRSAIRGGNVARPYLFHVDILLPPGMSASMNQAKRAAMFCHSAMTPGTTFYTNDDFVEMGIKRHVIYDYDYQNLSLEFLLDMEYSVKNFFDKWKDLIVPSGRNFNYPEDYISPSIIVNILSLKSVDSDNVVVYKYKYNNVYPKSIQASQLSQTSAGMSMCVVDFAFETVTFESSAEPLQSIAATIPQFGNTNGVNPEVLQDLLKSIPQGILFF